MGENPRQMPGGFVGIAHPEGSEVEHRIADAGHFQVVNAGDGVIAVQELGRVADQETACVAAFRYIAAQPAAHEFHQRVGACPVVEPGLFRHIQVGEGAVFFTVGELETGIRERRGVEAVDIGEDGHVVFHQPEHAGVGLGASLVGLAGDIVHDDGPGLAAPAIYPRHRDAVFGEYLQNTHFHREWLGFKAGAPLAADMQAQRRAAPGGGGFHIPRRPPAGEFFHMSDAAAEIGVDPLRDIERILILVFRNIVHSGCLRWLSASNGAR